MGMLSYTARRNLFGDLANGKTTEILALADKLMDIEESLALGSKKWKFLQKQFTLLTSSSNQFVTLSQYVEKVTSVYVTVAGYRYSPREVTSREHWDRLNEVSTPSDIPEWYFIYDGKIGLSPAPLTSSNVITLNSKVSRKTLSIADYTTGGILTAVVGSATLVGTGTAWATSMAGRWIKITESDTANKGDGYWYQILSVESTISLTLVRKYAGTAITAGNAGYTIGQCSILPEDYQALPLYGALRTYYGTPNPDETKAQHYEKAYKEMYSVMAENYLESDNVIRDDGVDCLIDNNGFDL